MVIPENAQDAYDYLVNELANPAESVFFQENPDLKHLVPAAQAVLGFAVGRPAILVNDATDKSRILKRDFEKPGLLFDEWDEQRDETNVYDKYKELGDLGFFALLAGVVYWPELNEFEREDVLDALYVSNQEILSLEPERIVDTQGVEVTEKTLGDAISYVANGKDAINYPAAFLQLKPDEKTIDIPQRITAMNPLLRAIRIALNGTWQEAGDLVGTLREHAVQNGPLAQQIVGLFTLAGLELEPVGTDI